MKKIIYLFALMLLTSSCSDLLNLDPEDFTAPETFYRNEKELDEALMAVYNPLLQYGLNLSAFMPMGTDEAYSRESSPPSQPYYYNFDAANSTILDVWKSLYLGIDRANALMENADQADCDEAIIKRIKGEALFLRSYYHFLLVAYWGDVPLKLKSTKSPKDVHVPRTPAKTIYEQIIKDMESSVDMVADLSELGYGGKVNKAAVKGILARVCLHAAGRLNDASYYPKARSWAWSLIEEAKANGTYALNPDYKDVFIKLMQDKYDIKECLFEVEFWGNTYSNEYRQVNQFTSRFGTNFTLDYKSENGVSNARSNAIFQVTPTFYDTFEDGDLRRDWNTYDYSYKSYNTLDKATVKPEFKFRLVGKYRREYEINLPVYTWGNSTNFPLLRYSDVLLMFAEADNEVNGGTTVESLDAVNQVRRRAFGLDVNTVSAKDVGSMSKTDFLKYIQDERLRELAFESHRKLDLIRWGIFLDRMKEVGNTIKAIPEKIDGKKNPAIDGIVFPGLSYVVRTYDNVGTKHLLMPIPELELSVNNAINSNNSEW
ncbi:MAG: RagB/SusD family nutrient uptake outer membrane protein [Dysgonomonas sp.]